MKINTNLIDKTDFITDTYSTSTQDTYSCNYVNEIIKIYTIEDVSISGSSQSKVCTLPSDYQGCSAYVVAFDDNGQWFTGGVNTSYEVFVRNSYTGSLTTNAKIICIE